MWFIRYWMNLIIFHQFGYQCNKRNVGDPFGWGHHKNNRTQTIGLSCSESSNHHRCPMLQHLPLIGVAIQLFHRPGEFSKSQDSLFYNKKLVLEGAQNIDEIRGTFSMFTVSIVLLTSCVVVCFLLFTSCMLWPGFQQQITPIETCIQSACTTVFRMLHLDPPQPTHIEHHPHTSFAGGRRRHAAWHKSAQREACQRHHKGPGGSTKRAKIPKDY